MSFSPFGDPKNLRIELGFSETVAVVGPGSNALNVLKQSLLANYPNVRH
ncbi:MAG TPA: hypothetical protein VF251_01140 [Pyrinomonadaceae bacterium]